MQSFLAMASSRRMPGLQGDWAKTGLLSSARLLIS